MDELVTRELSLTLNFKNREVTLEFAEPTIYDLIRFNMKIREEKYLSAIKIVIPNIDEKDFMSNPAGILEALKKLIYGEQKARSGSSVEEDSSGFFPSSIDMLAHRYGQLPTELIKKLTFTQMMICAKGYEWNLNVESGNEKRNVRLLAEMEVGQDQLDKDRDQIAKDREFFRKRGGIGKID